MLFAARWLVNVDMFVLVDHRRLPFPFNQTNPPLFPLNPRARFSPLFFDNFHTI